MALTKRERGTTWRAQVSYTSGSSYIDCSSNVTNLTVYKPDDTILVGPVSGNHRSTGIYDYYVSTASNADLGIYILEWKSWFSYDFGWEPKVDREEIQLCHVV